MALWYEIHVPNSHADITPSDSTVFPESFRALYFGGAGTARVEAMDGTIANYTVAAGARIGIVCRRVFATGTSATLIVGQR